MAIMAITLPTLIYLLADSSLDKYSQPDVPSLHKISIAHILSLAGLQPQIFKETVAVLSPEQKTKLEAAIKFN
ncbi:5790_t:CDS:1, partial [Acaulospora morrowiae]